MFMNEWEKNKPETLNRSFKGNSLLHTYYKQFSYLYFDPNSKLSHYSIDNPRSFEELDTPHSQPIINKTRNCLLSNCFMLLHVAQLPLWFSFFINDCFE